ncbi:MAG: hypothetical protein EAZ64_09535 [Sphingobacteriales bacterium]|nr:MAG: hypothetical protein EAZ64_09535 [Sphingobacteriales bacterium]
MKKLILIILCFLQIIKVSSQTPTADRVALDNIYQYINKSAIPTGYLNDYGAAFLKKTRYNGQMTDSNFIPNINVFRLTLNDLLSAKINPTAPNLPSIESVNNTIDPMLYNAATPLIFNISRYDTLHEMAVINNLLSFSNGSYYDVAGRSQSPYQTVNFFAACPINDEATATGTITLTYNSSLVYSNCGKQISTVAIDFGLGAGYQTLASGATLSQTYTDSTGYKAFGIKVTCTDATVYECISTQYVTVPAVGARYAASNIASLTQFPIGTPTMLTAYATVVYSNLRKNTPLANQLVKPLIMVEGLDENDLRKTSIFFQGIVLAGNKNMRTLLDDWDDLRDNRGYDFNGQLDDIAGYDLVYIDYHTLSTIPNSADVFIGLLNQINALKVNNASGVKEQNVVLGIELGGLVARYGLAKMTKAGQNTDTRLLITHDAPHQGAYMPLGYQHLAEDFGGMQLGFTRFKDMIEDFRNFEILKNTEVFKQMHVYTVNNGIVFTYTFLSPTDPNPNAYHQMVTFPAGITPSYQFVATSQGSQCGTQVLSPGENMLKFDNEIQSFNLWSKSWKIGSIKFKIGPVPVWIDLKMGLSLDAKFKLKLGVNALPAAGIAEISKAQLDLDLVLKTKFSACPYSFVCITVGSVKTATQTINIYNYVRSSPFDAKPFESYAGGTKNLSNVSFRITRLIEPPFSSIGNIPVNGVIVSSPYFVNYSKPTYSYVSRVSALDIQNPLLSVELGSPLYG